MEQKIVGVFDDREDAEDSMEEIRSLGIESAEISEEEDDTLLTIHASEMSGVRSVLVKHNAKEIREDGGLEE
jgi:hypothetical protein